MIYVVGFIASIALCGCLWLYSELRKTQDTVITLAHNQKELLDWARPASRQIQAMTRYHLHLDPLNRQALEDAAKSFTCDYGHGLGVMWEL